MADYRRDVTVTVTKVPAATGADMVRIDATWPGGDAEYLVTLAGPGFHSPSELARQPRWSYTGYLADGRYSLHVEGHAPAYFEVPSALLAQPHLPQYDDQETAPGNSRYGQVVRWRPRRPAMASAG